MERGAHDAVDALLQRRAKVNQRSKDEGWSALHVAALRGYLNYSSNSYTAYEIDIALPIFGHFPFFPLTVKDLCMWLNCCSSGMLM